MVEQIEKHFARTLLKHKRGSDIFDALRHATDFVAKLECAMVGIGEKVAGEYLACVGGDTCHYSMISDTSAKYTKAIMHFTLEYLHSQPIVRVDVTWQTPKRTKSSDDIPGTLSLFFIAGGGVAHKWHFEVEFR